MDFVSKKVDILTIEPILDRFIDHFTQWVVYLGGMKEGCLPVDRQHSSWISFNCDMKADFLNVMN